MQSLLCCIPLLLGQSPEWPEYRGPHADGDAGSARLPLTWSEQEHLRWKVAIPGRAWSTPVVAGARVWMTNASEDGHALSLYGVDVRSGSIVVEQRIFDVAEPQHINALNSHASPSPVAVGKYLFLHYGAYGTACFDTESSKVLWERRDLACEHLEGPGSSPVSWRSLLIFHMDGADEQYIIALDALSGETVWRVTRAIDYTEVPRDMRKAFGTPLLVEQAGEEALISSCAEATFAYDPSSGRELWRFLHKGFSMSARPIADRERVYLNTGFMKPTLLAVRLGGSGDISASHLVWRTSKNVPTMTSPLLLDGRLYLVDEGGIASCLEATSGRELWRERLGGEFSASPLHAAGRIYCFDRDGQASVLRAGEHYELLARNQLDSGCMASPIAYENSLLLRTQTHLYCIEE